MLTIGRGVGGGLEGPATALGGAGRWVMTWTDKAVLTALSSLVGKVAVVEAVDVEAWRIEVQLRIDGVWLSSVLMRGATTRWLLGERVVGGGAAIVRELVRFLGSPISLTCRFHELTQPLFAFSSKASIKTAQTYSFLPPPPRSL